MLIYIYIICGTMARTKQTARKALVGIQRIQFATKTVVQRARNNKAGNVSDSESIADFVNTQQFSLKFDDQDKCEKEAVEIKLHACKNCEAYFTSQSSILSKEEYKNKK